MPPTPQTNVRLSPGIKTQAQAAAETEGISFSELVQRALVAYLAGPNTAKDTGADTASEVIPDVVSALAAKLDAIADRVAALEQGAGAANQPGQAKTTPPPHAKDAPSQVAKRDRTAAGEEGEIKADGVRWLTTSQAVEVSQARGGPNNGGTLKRRGKIGELGELGLRWIPREPSKDNSLASFEDLRCPD